MGIWALRRQLPRRLTDLTIRIVRIPEATRGGSGNQAQMIESITTDTPSNAPPVAQVAHSFAGRVGLIVLSAGVMTLAFAPAGQWYLAWVGMTPWLVAIKS